MYNPRGRRDYFTNSGNPDTLKKKKSIDVSKYSKFKILFEKGTMLGKIFITYVIGKCLISLVYKQAL